MTPEITFYRSWQAFPHTKVDRPDGIMVSVSPNGRNQGGNYEFAVEHTGSERGRRPIALRVKMFADSWRAFADLPEFFALLAGLDESGDTQHGRTTLDDLIPHLVELGWEDRTPNYAAQHEHVWGCLTCSERMTTRPTNTQALAGLPAHGVAPRLCGDACETESGREDA